MRMSHTVQGGFLIGLLVMVSTAAAALAVASARTSAATPISRQSYALARLPQTRSLEDRPVVRAITVGRAPRAVAVAEQTHRVLVANAGDNSLSVLDTRMGAVLRTVPVGAAPAAVAVDEPTRRVFVAEAGANSVRVLDARTERVFLATAGPRRSGRATDPGSVSVRDARTGAIRRAITLGRSPRAIAQDSQTGRAFVITGGSNTVAILDGTG